MTFKIAGTFMWACLDRQNDMSGKYQVEVTNLSDAACKAVKEVGGTVQYRDDKPEKGNYVTCKSNYPIPAVDSNGNQIIDKVGNGSTGFVVIRPFEWSFKGKKGTSLGAQKLVIKNLVTYRDDTDAGDEDDSDVL